ncbi:MAG: cell division protein FtsA [Candidatus Chisholmbacteria bacterium]|nr:cell division protein FtsA [Candidatus Chisholmbacteria bacterium]
MAKGKVLAGIDVGTAKVCTIIAAAAEGKINVMGVSSTPSKGLRKSQIVDIEDAIEAITESVEAAERMAGYNINSAFVSIGGAHIASQNSKGVVAVSEPEGEIINDDVLRVIEAARAISLASSREILHVIPRDFIVDSQEGIKDPVGMTGVRLEAEAHIITGFSTAMRNLSKCVGEIGVATTGLVFSGLAAAEAVLTETERELGVVLADLGGGSTSLAVFVEGSQAHSAVIPIGARNITNDLAIGMRVSLDSAEKIKVALSQEKKLPATPSRDKEEREKQDEIDLTKLGIKEEISTASRKTLIDGIIRPRLNEIFTMIGLELKKSGFGGQTPAGVVLTGGGAHTVEIVNACKRTLSMPTRTGMPKGLSGLVEEIRDPVYAAATGLILYGLKNDGGAPVRSGGGGLGKVLSRLPVKGVVGKAADFIKSFLP